MSDFKLYEINHDIECLLDSIYQEASENDGLIDELKLNKLNEMNILRKTKLLDIARYIKSLESKYKALKSESDKLIKRSLVYLRYSQKLTDYLLLYIREGEKMEDDNTRLSWRKSTKIIIDDIDQIPSEFIKVEKTPIKSAIKRSFSIGQPVIGANLIKHNNLQII